mmetsp:Transcript_20175/g.28379  ORF Transcript_20175/g.28379 Transcript_20175/m.28379 type:complete len:123 (+) Transcript_20175:2240-2608(+)
MDRNVVNRGTFGNDTRVRGTIGNAHHEHNSHGLEGRWETSGRNVESTVVSDPRISKRARLSPARNVQDRNNTPETVHDTIQQNSVPSHGIDRRGDQSARNVRRSSSPSNGRGMGSNQSGRRG